MTANIIFDPIEPSSFANSDEVRAEITRMLNEMPLSTRAEYIENQAGFEEERKIVEDMVVDAVAAKATMEFLENYMKEQDVGNEWDLFMDAMTGAAPHHGWSKGQYGFFSERNMFGEEPNDRIESDLQ